MNISKCLCAPPRNQKELAELLSGLYLTFHAHFCLYASAKSAFPRVLLLTLVWCHIHGPSGSAVFHSDATLLPEALVKSNVIYIATLAKDINSNIYTATKLIYIAALANDHFVYHCFNLVSYQNGIVAFRKALTYSVPSLRCLPKVAPEAAPRLVWFNTGNSRPRRVRRPLYPFYTVHPFRRSALLCTGFSLLTEFLQFRNKSAMPSCSP